MPKPSASESIISRAVHYSACRLTYEPVLPESACTCDELEDELHEYHREFEPGCRHCAGGAA